jgi:hypothetical protein
LQRFEDLALGLMLDGEWPLGEHARHARLVLGSRLRDVHPLERNEALVG